MMTLSALRTVALRHLYLIVTKFLFKNNFPPIADELDFGLGGVVSSSAAKSEEESDVGGCGGPAVPPRNTRRSRTSSNASRCVELGPNSID